MSRPKPKLMMQVGRWQLLKDNQGWIVRDDNGHTCWPSSLAAAIHIMYENVIADNRFNDKKQNGIDAMRRAIIAANNAFNGLLTAEKIAELNEIMREGRR